MLEFIGIVATALVLAWLVSRNRRRRSDSADAGPERDQLYSLANSLEGPFMRAAHPSHLLSVDEFRRGVAGLSRLETAELLGYYRGDNVIIACMALEALGRQPAKPGIEEAILEPVNAFVPFTRYFALRALNALVPVDQPLVGLVLSRIDASWNEVACLQFLRDFVQARARMGETLTFANNLKQASPPQAEFIATVLQRLGDDAAPLVEELTQWQQTAVDRDFLRSIGTIAGERPDDDAVRVLEHPALLDVVATIEATLERPTPRSVLLVGEGGVGKSAIMRVVQRRLRERGWVVFEAGATELIAGMVFIGQLEERLRGLVQQLGGAHRAVWCIPAFQNLLWAGQTQFHRPEALDFLVPHIERGNVVVLGELQPSGLEHLSKIKPRSVTAFEVVRVEPLDREASLELGRRWGASHAMDGTPPVTPEVLAEAWTLAQQYMTATAAPGNLLELLEQTRRRLMTHERQALPPIGIEELIVTLSRLTGLPTTILDDREGLDLEPVRAFFERRVKGQPEAIDCLVERVAMIKAAVTDPTRPLGVFFFAGPTGTGKTQLAKTLAEFLFGSPDRMIRFDMSELGNPESLSRLLGEPREGTPGHESLVTLIRKQPFSVVLLDEFEKAHPLVWDLFLQVFDDGRLTDQHGNLADFRHAIVIMTSNLGALTPSGARLGFVEGAAAFNPREVERSIATTFRPEFLNRLDRVVVFRPLSRDTMREILNEEIAAAFDRRGLRNRNWAVEWDASGLEFLLEKGFTADLGARPLRRAVERYLLAPLATTIVEHRLPEGDQFLFVRSDGERIEVDFVDPDAPEPAAEEAEATPAGAPAPAEPKRAVQEIALDPHGDATDIGALRITIERLRRAVESESWRVQKQAALSMTEHPDFWHSPERFAVFAEVEHLDRIERGFASITGFFERLTGDPAQKGLDSAPRHLIKRIAERLFLLDLAVKDAHDNSPRDAFLRLEAGRDPRGDVDESNRFARELAQMYRSWAKKRRMYWEPLEERADDGAYLLEAAVSGFGAYRTLAQEAGLHVLEIPEQSTARYRRIGVSVRIAARPDEPAEGAKLQGQARAALGETEGAAGREGGLAHRIVRRYRKKPSPLVRDSVRGWRSGKLDRVLAGDFDLIAETSIEGART